jgi:hypothetical protein
MLSPILKMFIERDLWVAGGRFRLFGRRFEARNKALVLGLVGWCKAIGLRVECRRCMCICCKTEDRRAYDR